MKQKDSTTGTVYLVGGGPGDPELITAKGLRLIQQADCLVYDRLSSPELLRHAKPDCEKIYVGKQNRHHSMKQEDINQLLVDKAKEYPCVVRLKGGDVYVFGRGGEEGEVLRRNGVPFEVVSGVTSAIGGLAYAGIPITHRGVATGFRVFTAHNKDDKLTDLDFASLANTSDTAVFLMGLSKLEEIVEKLLEAGKNPAVPVAVISCATTPNQQTCTGDLTNIVERVRNNPKVVSPALIVVGEVVNLRKSLNFFEEKPLFGRNILLPRIENGKNSPLAAALTAQGAQVTELTVGKIAYLPHQFTKEELAEYSWIVFTSRNGVDSFFHALRQSGLDARSLANSRFVVIGGETKNALARWNMNADLMPEQFNSDALTQLLQETVSPSDCVFYPRAKKVDSKLEEALKGYCRVCSAALYENQPAEPEELDKETLEAFDGVVFTCASSVRRTAALFQKMGAELGKIPHVYSIGAKCSQALEQAGIKEYQQAEKSSYQGLVEKITGEEAGRHK
jgi:uroporphyrinogen III methyltransferase/synthase